MTRVGMVFVRQVGAPRTEEYFTKVIAGLEDALDQRSGALLVQTVEDTEDELSAYRHWARTAAVDAVVIKDLLAEDHRIELLAELRLPCVVLGDTTQKGPFSAVRFDNARAMRAAWDFLVAHGHRRVARVSGPPELTHIQTRTAAMSRCAGRTGIPLSVAAGDFSTESGAAATTALLTEPDPPTAIVYDNDLMALGGLAAVADLRISCPEQVALLAWDDSMDCQLARPALSALSHDVRRIGEQLGQTLLACLDTGSTVSDTAVQPVIVERGTTAPR